jgi:hypothetical protein
MIAVVTALALWIAGFAAAALPAQAASAQGGQISRAEIIQRAQYWVDHQPGVYSQT